MAANNRTNDDYKELVELRDFQVFSRSIQGAEITKTKLQRALYKANYLAKGLLSMGPSAKIMDEKYWQEALIPSHPSGAELQDFFDAWESSRSTLSFEDWYMQRPLRVRPPSLTYLTPEERKPYAVTFTGGKVYQNGAPLYTDIIESDKENGASIYVILSDGIMYVGPYLLSRFQHSSFNQGRPVIGAGEIKTDPDGNIIMISSKSGHYKPTSIQLCAAIDFLRRNGVDISPIQVEENTESSITRHPSAHEFLVARSPSASPEGDAFSPPAAGAGTSASLVTDYF